MGKFWLIKPKAINGKKENGRTKTLS